MVDAHSTNGSNGNGAGSHDDKGHSDHYTTRSIHIGSHPDPSTGAVVPSLSVATTYLQDGVNKPRGYDYSRSSNPTREILEEVLTSLETSPTSAVSDGPGGSRSDASGGETLVFASGSAGTAALAAWVSLGVEEGGAGGGGGNGGGGHVLAVNDVVSVSPVAADIAIRLSCMMGVSNPEPSRAIDP